MTQVVDLFLSFRSRAGTVIGITANLSWLLSVLVHPFMPGVSEEIQRQLQVGLRNSFGLPIYVINSVDITILPFYLSDKYLTLETTALKLFTMTKFTLSTQLIILNHPVILSHRRTTVSLEHLPPLQEGLFGMRYNLEFITIVLTLKNRLKYKSNKKGSTCQLLLRLKLSCSA